jgi:molybdate transport system substrate-binding protein
MRWISCTATAALACLFLTQAAYAAEIKVIASDGFALVLDAVKPKYEQASGNTLTIHYDVADNLLRDVLGSAPFDLVVTTDEAMRAIIQNGNVVTESRVAIARSGIGLAYKAGSPKPDIHDAASFKKTLLEAKSIAYTPDGASGAQFDSLVKTFGITDQVKAKIVKLPPEERGASSAAGSGGLNNVLQAVLDGRARYGIQAISNILPVKGLEYVSFPSDMQRYRAYSGAIGTQAKQPDGATALLKLLADPQFVPLIKSNGMEPG